MPDGPITSATITMPKQSAPRLDDIRKGILKKLAKGGIKQSELVRMFPNASMEVVGSVLTSMHRLGQVRIEQVDGWNVVSLPPAVEKSPSKEIKIEPIMPRVDPILPVIEPLERGSGVFVPDSPERLILGTLAEGARMRESLVRLVAGQMSSDEANKLLNKMIKSGIINETRSGRMSLVQKQAHV